MIAANQNLTSPDSTEILAYHGWGLDATCWQNWQTQFTQQGYVWKSFDRGYFSRPVQPEFSSFAQTKVIFVHSYGLHLCPIAQLQQADRLVIFSSFLNFHPESPSLRKRSQQMVQRMIDQFAIDPVLVLENFWQKCGWSVGDPLNSPPVEGFKTMSGPPQNWGARGASLNTDLLLQDLQQLNLAEFDRNYLTKIPQVVVLHGAQDRIVAAQRGHALSDQCFEIEAAGHALPFTHQEACLQLLQPIFDNHV